MRQTIPPRRWRKRAGGITLELIVCLPVFLALLAAVIEFGAILANLKPVSVASRSGARMLARLPAASFDAGSIQATVNQLKVDVDRELAHAGFTSCSVVVRHNIPPASGAGTVTTAAPATCACTSPLVPALPDGTLNATDTRSGTIRVTVAVPMSQLTPNLLSAFGFSTTNRTVEETTTCVYEGQ